MNLPLTVDARDHGLAGDGTTNDQPALQKLVDALGDACAADGRPRTVHVPAGRYVIRDRPVLWRSGVSLVGAGRGTTRFELGNPGAPATPVPLAWFTTAQHGAGPDHHIADVTFAHFEIDGSGVRTPEYDVLAKGLGLQYVLRGRFTDLWIHDTAATGFGCDFLQDTVVEGVLAERCGRQDSGEQMGGAGLGIGVGGWGPVERLAVTDCTATGNGTNGIFLELQQDHWTPPRGIRITACHAEDNRFGISDWGADGLLVTGCTLIGNHQAGFDVSSQGTTSIGGRGGTVTGCLIDGNAGDGVALGNTPGAYAFRGNRISNNGRYGYWQHNLAGGDQEAATDIVLESNDIHDNGLDGIRLDAPLREPAILGNRVRSNGRRAAPEARGEGAGVRHTARTLTDDNADWPPGGHRGKQVVVDGRSAVVLDNTATGLTLAPHRPGAATAWPDGTPAPGSAYRLPDAPAPRAGLTAATAVSHPYVHGNRIRDDRHPRTQIHALWLTGDSAWSAGRVSGNDFTGNASAATRFDAAPNGGRWRDNDG
ncbi:Parallel beta-helix repeat-containing protein [Streptomyces cyaneogriseus subsp. noncyanogenus]|uniref:Parallel beta-helix repeat-containing protein n=1 Tax=Streptomyces cyaneogriseus subsp. noncyanogenus TaxID=477245 RepID=A0A0C5G036_9ACTN|nr:right-handed parallel beta-helix repeat-containing protein [Streptomyces cyaneogriseus]AJP05722.1 Parallel beta-helix repeat-containing protein [Streptomyces cyaneogriseus subsp. noncyanogenus]